MLHWLRLSRVQQMLDCKFGSYLQSHTDFCILCLSITPSSFLSHSLSSSFYCLGICQFPSVAQELPLWEKLLPDRGDSLCVPCKERRANSFKRVIIELSCLSLSVCRVPWKGCLTRTSEIKQQLQLHWIKMGVVCLELYFLMMMGNHFWQRLHTSRSTNRQ